MNTPDIVRYSALMVGGVQLLANLLILLRGPGRIRAEFQSGAVSERFADLLSVSWVYGGLANLCIPILLLVLAEPLRSGSPIAWRATTVIGIYYVAVGIGTYFLGMRRHLGLLVFVLLGLALLVPLWVGQNQFAP